MNHCEINLVIKSDVFLLKTFRKSLLNGQWHSLLLINTEVLSRSKKTGNKHVAKNNIETHSHNHCCHAKAVITTYYERVSVAFVVHHAVHIDHAILSSVACPARSYFFHIIS